MDEITENQITHYLNRGALQSVDPPEAYFGFAYWVLTIPPFKPTSMLMLGCGGHTIPRLIRKIYGKVMITCVDNDSKSENSSMNLSMHYKQDAFDFVKECASLFDFIVIDLFDGHKTIRAIYEESFIRNLARISTGMIAVNTMGFEGYAEYQDYFTFVTAKVLKDNEVVFFKAKSDETNYFPIM